MSRRLPRVLVLTGTSDHPFPRLLEALPSLLREGVASEVRVQSRCPPPETPGIVPFGMLSREEVLQELAAADVVITHGGSGSIFDAIRAGHRPIVVPRSLALAEILDDHQADVAEGLARYGWTVEAADPLSESLPRHVRAASANGRVPPHGLGNLGPHLRRTLVLPEPSRRSSHEGHIRCHRVDAATYTAFYQRERYAHPLQSVAWGEARRLDGWSPEWWLAALGRSEPVAGAQVLRRANPLLPGYLPFGPAFAGSASSQAAARALLQHLARRSFAGLLWAPYAAPHQQSLVLDVPAVVMAPPSATGLVPLGSDESILGRMRPKWRWELQRALRDPRVEIQWERPPQSVSGILARVHRLAVEKGFHAPISSEVGAAFASRVVEAGVELICVTVTVAGRPTNHYVTSIRGDWAHTLWTAHEEGSSGGSGRVALWALLRACRERGATLYDLSGIDDVGNPGVASFKRGLRPDLVPIPGLRWLPPAWLPPVFACGLGQAWSLMRRRARPAGLKRTSDSG